MEESRYVFLFYNIPPTRYVSDPMALSDAQNAC
jgi:hypothetical protein